MPSHDALAWAQPLFLYIAAPALLLAGLAASVALRVPQIRTIGAAFAALREPREPGAMGTAASAWLAAAGGIGAPALVGAATAFAIGGAGAIAWAWFFGFMLAPLRAAEVWLARTNPPGAASGDVPKSLAMRLVREGGAARALGVALGLAGVAASMVVGGAWTGLSVREVSSVAGSSHVPAALIAVATVGAAIALAPASVARWMAVLGGLVGLLGLAALALAMAAMEPSRAMGALARTVGEALAGAPAATPFVGAAAGEIVRACVTNALVPAAANASVTSALWAEDASARTRAQVAAAMLEPLVAAVVVTLLGVATVATGVYFEPAEGTRRMNELVVLNTRFERPADLADPTKRFDGYIRLRNGTTLDSRVVLATERGELADPSYTYWGRPANVAIHVVRGEPIRLLRQIDGALGEVPIEQLANVRVRGETLPTGAELLTRALGGGRGADRSSTFVVVLTALFGALGVAAAGRAIRTACSARLAPIWASTLALLPAASVFVPLVADELRLRGVGLVVAAFTATLTSAVVLIRTRELAAAGRADR